MSIEWCAGFLDGEGSFCIPKRGRPVIAVQQNVCEPLDILVAELGGRTYGPYTRTDGSPRQKPYYQYALNRRAQIVPALHRLLPHLIVKRDDARLLLANLAESVLD